MAFLAALASLGRAPDGLASGGTPAGPTAERRATIFFTGSVLGTLEPCGCTSDPLGDVARMAGLVRHEQKEGKAVLVVDAGNLTYAGDISPRKQEAADLKAVFLARELGKLPFGGAALGETDLARGPQRVVPKRLAANVTGAPFVIPSKVETVGGIRVGILGLTAPEVARRAGLRADDPVTAARREAERLRKEGAEIVIALAALERAQARQIARGAPIDFVVVGQGVGDGLERADQVGSGFVLAPAVELQKLGRIDIVLRPGGAPGLVDAGSPEARALELAEAKVRLAELATEIARWASDKSADPSFVERKKKERQELEEKTVGLAKSGWAPPASGSYFSARLIPLRRALPRDPALAAAMRKLDQGMGRASLKTAEPPPQAGPDRAAFVGDKACGRCHKEEVAFWKKTVHAGAWKTLVDGGKTLQEDCVSCHVTGFGEVGGSSLGHTKGLEAIQCEACHGPGSLHVKAEGLEEPSAVRLKPAESTCAHCHNEKHSDTFNFVAYLRDITGPGHGGEARVALGKGPTGRELRAAAKARAKAAGAVQVGQM